MPFPRSFYKITLSGVLTGTDEVFNTSFHITTPEAALNSTQWDLIDSGVLDAIGAAAIAFWEDEDARIPSGWALDTVKIAWIGVDGAYITDAKEVELTPTIGGGILSFAPQLSLVGTMSSAKRKDPGKYNRMYFPTTVVSLYGGISLATGDQDAFLLVFRSMLNMTVNILQSIVDVDLELVAMSSAGAGYSLPIVDLRVGSVLDTQRRRRNKLPENYRNLAL